MICMIAMVITIGLSNYLRVSVVMYGISDLPEHYILANIDVIIY